jgi:hypothetical protein
LFALLRVYLATSALKRSTLTASPAHLIAGIVFDDQVQELRVGSAIQILTAITDRDAPIALAAVVFAAFGQARELLHIPESPGGLISHEQSPAFVSD